MKGGQQRVSPDDDDEKNTIGDAGIGRRAAPPSLGRRLVTTLARRAAAGRHFVVDLPLRMRRTLVRPEMTSVGAVRTSPKSIVNRYMCVAGVPGSARLLIGRDSWCWPGWPRSPKCRASWLSRNLFTATACLHRVTLLRHMRA